MKKFLLIMMAVAMTNMVQAQVLGQQKWSHELTTVEDAADLYLNAPVAVAADGSVITTGTFAETITIGETALEPIATSAYIAKYDTDGKAVWAVALQGSATIKSIDIDANGNIYVAGQYADVVVAGSADGNTKTINGEDGITEQIAAFVAKYDAAGNLKAIKTIKAEGDAEMLAQANDFIIMYFPENFPFYVKKLEVEGDKVYLSASHMGNVTVDNVEWKGSYATIWGMLFDNTSMGIVSMNADDLSNTTSVAHIEADFENTEDLQYFPEDLNFTVENSTVYAAVVGFGKQIVTTSAGVKKYEFTTTLEGAAEHALVLAKIDGITITDKVFNTVANDATAKHNLINNMRIEGDNIILAGTFMGALPFNNEIVSKGVCDVYVANVEKSNLAVVSSFASGAEENIDKDGNASMSIYEVVGGMITNDGIAFVSSYVYNSDDNTISAPMTYNVYASGEMTAGEKTLITSMAANESLVVTLKNDTRKEPVSTITVYEMADGATSIAPVTNTDDAEVIIFDLTGRRVDTVTVPGVYIVNGKKVIVK